MDTLQEKIAAHAAELIVEHGLDYGSAKRRAAQALGVRGRAGIPANEHVERHVREYLALFHGDTQPGELAALRALALHWMERLQAFKPHVCGAVWNGTATRHSDIRLDLFCDDPKSAEIMLINQGLRYTSGQAPGIRGLPVDTLSFSSPCPPLPDPVGIHLAIYDRDDIRGALRARGRNDKLRGDPAALRARMGEATPAT